MYLNKVGINSLAHNLHYIATTLLYTILPNMYGRIQNLQTYTSLHSKKLYYTIWFGFFFISIFLFSKKLCYFVQIESEVNV